jgi:hypothetical protein
MNHKKYVSYKFEKIKIQFNQTSDGKADVSTAKN